MSLAEAFWAPWRKLGEGVASSVQKFLGDKQAAAQKNVEAGTQNAQAGGAAMASSVAAIGIGVAMVGSAAAALMAAISRMTALQIAISVVALILVVSLPSVILTWFKLRRRDLGAILNACGWAVNRPMRFSMRRARAFTICAPCRWCRVVLAILVVLIAAGTVYWYFCPCSKDCKAKVQASACAVEAPAN